MSDVAMTQPDPETAPAPQTFAPGFYNDGTGVDRWYDGEQWTVHARPGTTKPLVQFVSHIEGRNATVSVFEDRVEWERPRTLLKGSQGTEMVPVKGITSVTTQRNGILNTLVHLTLSGGRMSFNTSHGTAQRVREILNGLILGTPQRLAADGKPDAEPVAAAASGGLTAEITHLATLREAGMLTEEEFSAAKRKLLGL